MDKSTDNNTPIPSPPIFTNWINTSSVLAKSIQVAKDMYQAVYDINTEMTNLAKISNATSDQLNSSLKASIETAKKYGVAVSDVINATADWSRLGYNLPDSEKLAKVSAIYKNIGNGIDTDTANKNLLSALQGYQLSADEALSVIDKFSGVANTLPTGSAGIGEALQHSASAFYDANTSLSKSIALIAGTNSVIQNPESVGEMWETVSMRIRGAESELEEVGLETYGMIKSTSQLRSLVEGMTGFDIMTDDNTLKDVYDIVVGIGEKWGELTNIEQSSLLDKLAGSNQADALNVALNNVDLIKKAYASAENSDGASLREQAEYLSSLEGKTAQFEAAFESLSGNILDSDLLKFFVDLGTTGVNALDSLANALTPLGTLAAGAGLFAGVKNIGRVKCYPSYRICL